jgi:uncharacterized membrane protein
MKKIFLFFLIIFLVACQDQTKNAGLEKRQSTNDSTSGISSDIKEKDIDSNSTANVEIPLYLAQCSEPFMAAYFFEHKIRLIFPEKTDSILNNDNTLNWNKDFEGNFISVNKLKVRLSIKNKPCVHPGSGESWEKMVTFVINNQEYKGCLKKINY